MVNYTSDVGAEIPREKFNGEQLAHVVSNSMNPIGFQTNAFIHTMGREHRTLQQLFTTLCLKWLIHLANLDKYGYDGRNEASVKIAKVIVEAMRLHYGYDVSADGERFRLPTV